MDAPLDKVLVNTPPPPPMEVKIRTMRSDIESMRRSGGGAPTFQDLKVKGLSMEKEYRPSAEASTPMPPNVRPSAVPVAAPESAPAGIPTPPSSASESHLVPIVIVTIVALLAIGVVGYFVYTLFF